MVPKPRFTVIVPVYKVQGYLRECIESVLSQTFSDFELLAVVDASPDKSIDILRDLEPHEARLQIISLPQNVGLGFARNAGLAQARGEYVVFLDSDDTFTPTALADIDRAATRADDPDVVMFDYIRTWWWGRHLRNQMASRIQETAGQIITLEDNPDLLQIIPVAWNKAYKREFIESEGLEFPQGYYEDIPFTYPALIFAQSLTTVDRVCVYYRQRRHGNILSHTSERHFELFDQYDSLFTLLQEHGKLEEWLPHLFPIFANHVITLVRNQRRLPYSSKRKFFKIASRTYRNWAPLRLEIEVPKRKWYRLIRWNWFDVFQLLSYIAKNRRKMARRARKFRRSLGQGVKRIYYLAQARLPIAKNVLLFSEYWGEGYQCNPRAIYEYVRDEHRDYKSVWVLSREAAQRHPELKSVRPFSFGYWKALARARIFINNVNYVGNIKKRAGQVHIQTQHGTPLKYVGIDMRHREVSRITQRFGPLLARSDRWDYNLSSNLYSSEVWERAFPCTFDSVPFGYPRNDALVNASTTAAAQARSRLGIPKTSRVILYAPTYREVDLGGGLDLVDFQKSLRRDDVLLLRMHHKVAELGARKLERAGTKSSGAQVIDVSKSENIPDLYLAADVLVTDYSSVMFDYAILNKPTVIYAEDYELYDEQRGLYFDIRSAGPGLFCDSQSKLELVLATESYKSAEAQTKLDKFRARFTGYDRGNAAERVFTELIAPARR